MFNRKIGFVSSMLLLSATACFAQSSGPPTATIPTGSSLKLRANSVNATSYQWLKDGVIIDNATDIEFTAFLAGTYTVISYNAEGCASEISDALILIGTPFVVIPADLMVTKRSEIKGVTINAPFEYTIQVRNNGLGAATLVKIQDILPDELTMEQLNNPSMGFARYNAGSKTILWEINKLENGQFADLKIKVKSTKAGVIHNTATVSATEPDPNMANNTSTDIKSIANITIPNVFTPNGDGLNDTFNIPGLEFYGGNEISIFNRWGGMVYQKKDYKNDWDGSQLNEGTYFYLLKIKTATNEWEVYKGFVTLIR